jgi:hypothetical protein
LKNIIYQGITLTHNYKILVSTGCSFTAGHNKWNEVTAEGLNIPCTNYAKIGSGNAHISRSLVYGVYKALETYDPSEILVGIMWSGKSRYDNYHADLSVHKFKNKPMYNFVEEDPTGGYVRIPHDNPDWYSAPFFRLYYDEVGACIHTFDQILKAQWLLESHNIQYFMTCYDLSVLPEEELTDHPSLKHLKAMINWDKFLPVNNCFDWCVKSGIPGYFPDEPSRLAGEDNPNKILQVAATHPTPQQQQGFAEQVILPFLLEKYNIS